MEISVQILYGQLAVSRPEIALLNLWSDDDVAQGFSWREGSISFGVPDHDGPSVVEVNCVDTRPEFLPNSIHAVEAPLRLGDDGLLLATVTDEIHLRVRAGLYSVRCELIPGTHKDSVQHPFRIRLTFIRDPQS